MKQRNYKISFLLVAFTIVIFACNKNMVENIERSKDEKIAKDKFFDTSLVM